MKRSIMVFAAVLSLVPASALAKAGQEPVCDLVAPGGDLAVQRDGSVYRKGSHPFAAQGESIPSLPDVVMLDKGGKATLQAIAAPAMGDRRVVNVGYVKPDMLKQYKQIQRELPGVHSAKTGLPGLSKDTSDWE